MPIVKFISGHTSVKWCARYLMKDGRALAKDFIMISERDRKNTYFTRVMDETRDAFGNNTAPEGKRCRTYEHVIVSLSPEDGAGDLDDFREMIRQWAVRNFNGYQIAIAYHSDNKQRLAEGKEGLLHAHLIINNTNLDDGSRISSHLTNKRVAAIVKDMQKTAHDWLWSSIDEEVWDRRRWLDPELSDRDEHRARRGLPPISRERRQGPTSRRVEDPLRLTGHEARRSPMSKSERGFYERNGWSWKQDLREAVASALATAKSDRELKDELSRLGVGMRKRRDGEYVFTHRDSARRVAANQRPWSARGSTLGERFAPSEVRRAMRANFFAAHERDDGRGRGRASDELLVMGRRCEGVTLADVKRLIQFIMDNHVYSLEDLRKIHGDEARAIEELARKTGIFTSNPVVNKRIDLKEEGRRAGWPPRADDRKRGIDLNTMRGAMKSHAQTHGWSRDDATSRGIER